LLEAVVDGMDDYRFPELFFLLGKVAAMFALFARLPII
jgi:hypothetical protein